MKESLLLFGGLALVTVATPGPTTLLALQQGARHGVPAALPGMAGAVLSDAVLIAAVAAGLGGLLAASATAFEWLRWAGVLTLAWLGWRLLHAPKSGADAASATTNQAAAATRRERPEAVFRRSFTVAVTNPKGYLFFSALLPSFVDPAAPLWPQYALLATVFAAIDGAVLLGYAAAGTAGARRLGPGIQRGIDQTSGLVLIALAAALALWHRPTP
ncbi:LysE family translocator [Acidovorax lacteus]|uniref:LysE family translocator n=1 Tax=Acidovorax lacteus TaxID=1924988 RepID=A0ABP8LLF6_9BURK